MRAAPAGTRMTEARAWRLGVPRAAETGLGLIASVIDVEEATCDHTALIEDWDATAVAWRLEGEGTPGLAVLDAPAAAALVEIQTLRRVGKTALAPRPATPIDAALCAPMVGDWMAARDAALADDAAGWRLGKPVTTARAARFLLEEGEYRTRHIRVSFADGAREGTLMLALPVPPPADLRGRTPRTARRCCCRRPISPRSCTAARCRSAGCRSWRPDRCWRSRARRWKRCGSRARTAELSAAPGWARSAATGRCGSARRPRAIRITFR